MKKLSLSALIASIALVISSVSFAATVDSVQTNHNHSVVQDLYRGR